MVLCVEEYPDEVGYNKGEDVQATRAAEIQMTRDFDQKVS